MGASKDSLVEIRIPDKPEFLRVVRLFVAGYAARWALPVDVIEDIKVAVSEACNSAINCCSGDEDDQIRIKCWYNDGCLFFEIKDKSMRKEKSEHSGAELEERGLGMLLIRTLMDEVEEKSKSDKGTCITMKKNILPYLAAQR